MKKVGTYKLKKIEKKLKPYINVDKKMIKIWWEWKYRI